MSGSRGLPPLLVAMEALWLWAAIAVLVSGMVGPAGPPLWAVAAAIGSGYAAAWLARHLDVDEDATRLLGPALGLAVLALTLRLAYAGDLAVWRPGIADDFLRDPGPTYETYARGVTGAVALCGVWLRGAWVSGFGVGGYGAVARSFAYGVAWLSLGLVFSDLDAPRVAALPFVALGLAALAIARAEAAPVGRGGGLPRWWYGMLAAALAAALFIAALLVVVPWQAVRDGLAPAGAAAVWLLAWAMIIVLAPVFFVVEAVLRALFAGLAAAGFSLPDPPTLDPEALRDEEARNRQGGTPRWILLTLRYTAMGAVAAAGLWVASLPFRRRWRAKEDEPERAALGEAPSSVGERKGGRRPFGRGEERPGGGPIGRLYGELLVESARRGLPRPPSSTPLEFAPGLAAQLGAPVAAEISEAFARARYGGVAVAESEVERLRRTFRANRPGGGR